MRVLLSGLARNLLAGTRLALWLPVRRLDFHASAADFAMLFAFNFAAWLAAAALREGRAGDLEPLAVSTYFATAPLLLGGALAIARIYREPQLLLPLAVALASSDLAFELAGLALLRLAPASWTGIAYLFFFAWIWAIAVRAVAVVAGARRPQLWLGAGVASAMIATALFVFPKTDVWSPPQQAQAAPRLAEERVFHLQGELLGRALEAVAPGRSGEAELYFVGFAPDGSQDVFLREMRSIRAVVEKSYGAAGRTLVLANGDGALEEFPLATVSNLRRALDGVAARMNPDEDVLLLYLSAHGDAQFSLSAHQPPLRLAHLNPTALARMLQDAGIRWKAIVVSACHGGGFIEPLKDAGTLVITAARADRSSFGCEHGRESTYFGNALFNEGLVRTNSLAEAFKLAREAVAKQEAAEGLTPSEPQIWMGEAIAERLKALER
jgi:hypothetical protein